ncbi:vWA domain-containing protein [Endothiovibrio diazotrophicus]
MSGKKKGNWILVVLVLGAALFHFLGEQNGGQPTVPPVPRDGAQLLRPELMTYGRNGARDDWPNMSDAAAMNLRGQLAKNYYVILDDSGSMKEDRCADGYPSKLSAAIDALATFSVGLPPAANLGVMSFDGGRFTERLPLGRHTTEEIRGLASRMRADGATPLATAITRGYEALRRQAVAQLGYGEYHLVVITDGAATKGEYPDAVITRVLTESPVNVHTIGFCIGKDHVLNQPRYLAYQAADDVRGLRQGLRDVLAEAPAFTVSSF